MTHEKDDRPTTATGGIETNNGMNDTNVIPLLGASHHMTGERMDGGLFYFREMPPTRAFKTTTTIPFYLWHKRLGHPSLEVLKLLPQLEYFVSRDVDFLENIFPYDTEPITLCVDNIAYNDDEYPSQEMDGSVTIPVNENTMPHDDEDQVVVNENTDVCTDIAKISRKRSKSDKHGHENG
ncbi:hypothetical protein Tco_0455256 [Tanacetum coccineum]